MKRVHDAAWPMFGLGAVAVASWLLFKDVRGLSLASLKSAFISISPIRWLLAIGSTSFAYAALASRICGMTIFHNHLTPSSPSSPRSTAR